MNAGSLGPLAVPRASLENGLMSGKARSDEEQLRAWIEERIGGRVVRSERQPRWRPAWFIDVERPGAQGGEHLRLYVRGDRGLADHGVYSLEREMRVLQVLESQGIPVPHIYGFCEEPRGIVMQWIPGRNCLAEVESEDERHAVLDRYLEILARLHGLETSPFEAIGLERPTTAAALGLADLERWERAYRTSKRRPEPLIEFALRWLRSNTPEDRKEASFVCADSGQFLFEDGQVTALLDLELSHLGDPLEDLAGMRSRDLSEPLGDLTHAVHHYESLTGKPVDRSALDYHTARFSLVTPLAVAAHVAAPPPGLDLVQYLAWYHVYGRTALEIIAHATGVSLSRPALPAPSTTRVSVAHDSLVGMLEPDPSDADYAAYRADAALRLARYLQRCERYAAAIESDDLDEVAGILGHRPASWLDADAQLEELIIGAPRELDAELLRYLHARALREEALLQPVLRELANASIQMIGGS